MYHFRSKISLACCFFLFITIANAQWNKIQTGKNFTNIGKAKATIYNASLFNADAEKLKDLKALPVVQDFKDKQSASIIEIPLPDGSLYRARVFNYPILHAELQAKYPDIYSFTGYGIDEQNSIIKCDIGPAGFHAMILSPKYGTIFIDPLQEDVEGQYISYYKKDYATESKKSFSCIVDDSFQPKENGKKHQSESLTSDCILRKYRLALACTGEYASFHGGTKAKALAAMNTTMTRVSGVYERDLAVTFEIIQNNDLIIFLNGITDPYFNNDGGAMLGQNQATIDATIGSANYDIGHVFSTGGGGIASLYAICNAGNKAQGVTGSGSPVGDPFDIDYVAHEMGHQFNANHSFNNDCGGNINPSTAFEPGSGTTIMAYAGVCDPNVAFNSDDLFHKISLDEISNYITQEAGNTCPVKINLDNNAPSVNAGLDQIIPKSTPFELSAIAIDPEGDSLTYCWEQFDNEIVTHPPVSTYTNGPSFRSFKPTDNPTRIFPQIATIVANNTSLWEVLPGAARKLNFSVSVRDNHQGGGCYATDDLKLTVNASAGPFLVTAPNSPLQWTIGETQTVLWNVANTEKSPINCAEVDIYLSTDGGFTYPILLVSAVANTGSYPIEVPNYPGTKNRIKVKAHNNVFFDISNTNFTIKIPTSPTFSLFLNNPKAVVCTEQDTSANFVIKFTPLAGFNDTVTTTIENLPPGIVASISPEKTTLPSDVTITLSGLQNASSGAYTINVTAKSGSLVKKTNYNLNISNGLPEIVNIQSIENNAKSVSIKPSITWDPVPGANLYHLVLAKDYLLNSIVYEADYSGTSAILPDLDLYSVYFWNIHAINDCGKGLDSETRAFQTINKLCNTYTQDSALTIPDNLEYQGSTILNISDNFAISDLSVKINALHTFISDLKIDLQGPDDQIITLFGNSCDDLDDMDVNYSDKGVSLVCKQNPPAVSGTLKPASGELKQWNAKGLSGAWKLNITDIYPEDGGILQTWSITACKQDSAFATPVVFRNNVLYVLELASEKIDSTLLLTNSLNQNPNAIRYFLTKTTSFGQIRKGSTILKPGDSFSQADINQKLINYKNQDFGIGQDAFEFYVIDGEGNWNPSQKFKIVIFKPLSASITSTEIKCNGDSTANITIMPEGGVAPYLFSIDGGTTFQAESSFFNLKAGAYTVLLKDTLGNTFNQLVIINEPPVLVVDLVNLDDMVTLNISGGTPPYLVSSDSFNYTSETLFDSLSNGLYTFYVKDANDCLVSDTITIKGVSTSNLISKGIDVYPVPADQQLILRFRGATPFKLFMTDLFGIPVWKADGFQTTNGVGIIDTQSIPSGIYFLSMNFESETIIQKIIITH